MSPKLSTILINDKTWDGVIVCSTQQHFCHFKKFSWMPKYQPAASRDVNHTTFSITKCTSVACSLCGSLRSQPEGHVSWPHTECGIGRTVHTVWLKTNCVDEDNLMEIRWGWGQSLGLLLRWHDAYLLQFLIKASSDNIGRYSKSLNSHNNASLCSVGSDASPWPWP